MSDVTFSSGDVLIDRGHVFLVKDVKQKKNLAGKLEEYLILKPYFQTPQMSTLTKSIPVRSINHSNQRKPIIKKELSRILTSLKKLEPVALEAMAVKEDIKDASFEEAAQLAKQLWYEQQDENSTLSFTKKQVFKKAVKQLSQEIAVIKKLEFEDAEKSFNKSLAA